MRARASCTVGTGRWDLHSGITRPALPSGRPEILLWGVQGEFGSSSYPQNTLLLRFKRSVPPRKRKRSSGVLTHITPVPAPLREEDYARNTPTCKMPHRFPSCETTTSLRRDKRVCLPGGSPASQARTAPEPRNQLAGSSFRCAWVDLIVEVRFRSFLFASLH